MREGWFRTGDLGRRDEDGWYYVVGRCKDLIIRGGYNVYPREVEDALMRHPAVSLAAVVGRPHEVHGEEVVAYVVLARGATVTGEDLLAWSRQQLASYKYPRSVVFLDSLPLTPTGKVLKSALMGSTTW